MKFKNVVLEKFSSYLPKTQLSSAEIEDRLAPLYEKFHLSKGRIELMTGVQKRHLGSENDLPSELAFKAVSKIDIDPLLIDGVIFTSVCRDFLEPASASLLHQRLGLKDSAFFMDLSNACLGMLSALQLIAPTIDSKTYKRVLIVSGEDAGPLYREMFHHFSDEKTINQLNRKAFKQYFANFTLGSAGAAWLVTHEDEAQSGRKVQGLNFIADSKANHLCRGTTQGEGLMMQTDSPELMQKGLTLAKKNFAAFKAEFLDHPVKDIIPHQVGSRHINELQKALGLHEAHFYQSFSECGNTGASAIALTLDQFYGKQGHDLALFGIGSGLSSIMVKLC